VEVCSHMSLHICSLSLSLTHTHTHTPSLSKIVGVMIIVVDTHTVITNMLNLFFCYFHYKCILFPLVSLILFFVNLQYVLVFNIVTLW
jgi:hypothetical protein